MQQKNFTRLIFFYFIQCLLNNKAKFRKTLCNTKKKVCIFLVLHKQKAVILCYVKIVNKKRYRKRNRKLCKTRKSKGFGNLTLSC